METAGTITRLKVRSNSRTGWQGSNPPSVAANTFTKGESPAKNTARLRHKKQVLPLRSAWVRVLARRSGPFVLLKARAEAPASDVWASYFHLLDQDQPAQVGKDQEKTILKDTESLDQEHDQYMQDLKSGSLSD